MPTQMTTKQVLDLVKKEIPAKPLDPDAAKEMDEAVQQAGDQPQQKKGPKFDESLDGFQVMVLAMALHGACCRRSHYNTKDCQFAADLDGPADWMKAGYNPVRVVGARYHWLKLAEQRIRAAGGNGEAVLTIIAMIKAKDKYARNDWLYTKKEREEYEKKNAKKKQQEVKKAKEIEDFINGISADEAEETTQQFAGGSPQQVNDSIKKGENEP
jgi:cell fate (sporulation/competence/biofilm development) regulator YmcA (YheA/YmcA/DUF963 family)